MPYVRKSKLPRLPREWYVGQAIVHWTHTLEDRATGWLDERFHGRFREVLVHTCSRYELVCPTYSLMPDHQHIVWMGTADESDQLNATAFLRKHLAPELGQARFQDRAHDRVLREKDRRRFAFQDLCGYVLANPERAELVTDWREWAYLGAIVPGYPVLDPRAADFWDHFWKLYYQKLDENFPALPRRATTDTRVARPVTGETREPESRTRSPDLGRAGPNPNDTAP